MRKSLPGIEAGTQECNATPASRYSSAYIVKPSFTRVKKKQFFLLKPNLVGILDTFKSKNPD